MEITEINHEEPQVQLFGTPVKRNSPEKNAELLEEAKEFVNFYRIEILNQMKAKII